MRFAPCAPDRRLTLPCADAILCGMKNVLTIHLLLLLLLCCACRTQTSDPAQASEQTAVPAAENPSSEAVEAEIISVEEATIMPTEIPTPEPTDVPTPTTEPTAAPTFEPTAAPTPEPTAVPAPTPVAVRKDLSKKCTFRFSNKKLSQNTLIDNKLKSNVIVPDQTTMTYSWKDSVPARMLYLFSYERPKSIHVVQTDGQGKVLYEKDVKLDRMCWQLPLEEGCRSVSVKTDGRCKINALQIFGDGNTYPSRTVWWTPVKERKYCDLMLVSTHFDDEILMMGGVLPIYAGEQGRDCVVLYMKGTDKLRKMEGMQGVWEMGVKREPLYLSCTSDSLAKALENDAAGVFEKDDLEKVVLRIRRFRPLVVVTHDVDGEYGHESHVKTSAIVRRAVELAADPSYDPDTVEKYGTWQVQKLYIHLWKENKLELDIKSPLRNLGGRSAYQVAQDAFEYHKTQQKGWSVVSTNKEYPIGSFGLYFSAVGPDSGINDMMEHVIPPVS